MATGRTRRRRKPTATVRGFRRSDIEPIRKLFDQTSVVEGTLQLPHQDEARLRERLESPPRGLHRLVAELGGTPVAVGTVFQNPRPRLSHTGTVGLLVSEEARRQGVGGVLLDGLLSLSDDWLGLTRLELTVWVDHEPAIRLYRSRDFLVEGVARAFGLREGRLVDAFYMGRVRSQLAYPRVTAEETATKVPPLLTAGPDRSKN